MKTLLMSTAVIAALTIVQGASAQGSYVVASPPVWTTPQTVYYAPTPTYAAPAYVAQAPTTVYYAPAPVMTYYRAPAVSYYAPQAYYAQPVFVAPSPVVVRYRPFVPGQPVRNVLRGVFW